MTDLPHILVSAAIIERDGAFLVTRRRDDVHLAGLWEFPGGKCEPGESHEACLRREIVEELDSDVTVMAEIFRTSHAYPDRIIDLHFFRCELTGTPRPMIGQEMRWVRGDALLTLEFPPADAQLIDLLGTPVAKGSAETTVGASTPAVTTATAVPGSAKSRCT